MLSEQQRGNKLWHLGKKQRRQPALKEPLHVAAAAAYRSAPTCAREVSAEAGRATSGHSYFTLQRLVSLNLYTAISCLFPVILHPESFSKSLNRASGAHQGMWEYFLCCPERKEGRDEEKTQGVETGGTIKVNSEKAGRGCVTHLQEHEGARGRCPAVRHCRGCVSDTDANPREPTVCTAPFQMPARTHRTASAHSSTPDACEDSPHRQCAQLRSRCLRRVPLFITGLGARGFHFTPMMVYGTEVHKG